MFEGKCCPVCVPHPRRTSVKLQQDAQVGNLEEETWLRAYTVHDIIPVQGGPKTARIVDDKARNKTDEGRGPYVAS